ncbi:MAG: methionyl-tRNA formyltransferase [Pseudomonadota bacterium]
MRVIFMGTPQFSLPALEALIDAGHEVVAVYAQPPRPAGRGKQPRPGPVLAHAQQLGLPTATPLNFKRHADRADFAALNADVAVVVAYGLILPQELLDAPHFGCLNIHASLLPRWRGAAPIHRAVMEGDAKTGICIMQMEAGLDTGPVLNRAETGISAQDTTGTLHDRLAQMGAHLIVETVDGLPMAATPQDTLGVSYAQKIDKTEARIDWSKSAADVDRQIRGLSPAPGAWTQVGDERLKVLGSAVVTGVQGAEPGTTLDDRLTVACANGAVRLTSAQRAGKSAAPTDQVLRGFPVPKGTQLG